MLAAILHGKAARVSLDGKDVTWRELFRQREDLLTATFFKRFLYLSPKKRREALALLVGVWAGDLGDVEEIIFWPSLRLSENEGGKKIEPDVIVECEHGLIMVEVKPPWGRQYEEQWHNEVRALMEAFKSKANVSFDISNVNIVHFVSLGQNSGLDIRKSFEFFDTKGLFEFEPHQKEWSDILRAVDGWAEAEESSDKAVVSDWISAFNLFGIYRPVASLAKLCKQLLILEDPIPQLIKMKAPPPESEHKLPPLSWHSLLSLSCEYSMEDSQCKSLLKKLASS